MSTDTILKFEYSSLKELEEGVTEYSGVDFKKKIYTNNMVITGKYDKYIHYKYNNGDLILLNNKSKPIIVCTDLLPKEDPGTVKMASSLTDYQEYKSLYSDDKDIAPITTLDLSKFPWVNRYIKGYITPVRTCFN